MHGTVRIRDLFNFFLCCCLLKGIIFHRFLIFVLLTNFFHSSYFGVACVIYLRDWKAQNCSPKPWLGIAIRQVNYNQAPQVKNLNNTKKGKGEKSSRKIPKSRSCPLQAMVAHVPVKSRRSFPCSCIVNHEGEWDEKCAFNTNREKLWGQMDRQTQQTRNVLQIMNRW